MAWLPTWCSRFFHNAHIELRCVRSGSLSACSTSGSCSVVELWKLLRQCYCVFGDFNCHLRHDVRINATGCEESLHRCLDKAIKSALTVELVYRKPEELAKNRPDLRNKLVTLLLGRGNRRINGLDLLPQRYYLL